MDLWPHKIPLDYTYSPRRKVGYIAETIPQASRDLLLWDFFYTSHAVLFGMMAVYDAKHDVLAEMPIND